MLFTIFVSLGMVITSFHGLGCKVQVPHSLGWISIINPSFKKKNLLSTCFKLRVPSIDIGRHLSLVEIIVVFVFDK